ncbi:MAG: SurA N-terminal domain-containing protein [Burkholderiales bacterium]|nr:SurA N-terminal domain-containing protein [Burkholderiales bacterium]
MFDFVRNHTRVLFFVVVLLILPSFVFFGVQGYTQFNDPAGVAVARVDGQKISRAEWDASHRRQAAQMRRQMPNLDVAFFDSPEVQRETLDRMVRERVLLTAANRAHFSVSDERLQRELMAIPQLATLRRPDGSIDVAAYKALIESQGQTPQGFEANLRQGIAVGQVLGGVSNSVPPAGAPGRVALEALLQQREVQVLRFDSKEQVAGINPSQADLAAYHKTNEARFRAPEQASIEYVVLDLDALKIGLAVPEDDLRKYYTENAARYTVAEERRASHVLIAAAKDAPAAERTKAKVRAEALLADLRKTPASFAEVAKKNSSDTASAERGGDLDYFARGAMVKPFEDAAYAMKPGEIGNVVETDFGYHIIRLDAVRGGDKKPFEAVRAEIEDEVKKQLAQKKYAEAAEQFTNTAYEQADSLQPLIDKLKLKKQTATVQRTPAPGASGTLASAKLLAAVFGNDALKNKRNTEAVEVGPNQLAAARVLQYQPARVQALAEVMPQVRERVLAEQAGAAARKAGEARLAALRGGADVSALPPTVVLSRASAQNQPRALIDAVLRADAGKLPQWLGVDLGDAGYAVVRLTAVKVLAADTPELTQLLPRYAQAWGAAEGQAYYNALKSRYKVSIETNAVAAASTAAN